MARPYSLDLRERVGYELQSLPGRGGAVQSEHCQCGEVVASRGTTGRPAAKPVGGKRPNVLAGEAKWLLAAL